MNMYEQGMCLLQHTKCQNMVGKSFRPLLVLNTQVYLSVLNKTNMSGTNGRGTMSVGAYRFSEAQLFVYISIVFYFCHCSTWSHCGDFLISLLLNNRWTEINWVHTYSSAWEPPKSWWKWRAPPSVQLGWIKCSEVLLPRKIVTLRMLLSIKAVVLFWFLVVVFLLLFFSALSPL